MKFFEARPWGSFSVLDIGSGYKVKSLHVNSKSRLSYQSHNNRSEHWQVVCGEALITLDGVDKKLGVGDFIEIPVSAKHRISNPYEKELIIIEIQIGNDLSEEDIIRYEDDYNRLLKNDSK